MRIVRVPNNQKRAYRDLLLLADEQWSMVERYLDAGEMWAVVIDDAVVAECVVAEAETHVGDDVGGSLRTVEIMNLAVDSSWQGQGIGRALVEHVRRTYAGRFSRLRVCTGDSPLTVPFYQRCGFAIVGRVPNYFTEHYDHPIYEAGKLLTDLVVLEMDL